MTALIIGIVVWSIVALIATLMLTAFFRWCDTPPAELPPMPSGSLPRKRAF